MLHGYRSNIGADCIGSLTAPARRRTMLYGTTHDGPVLDWVA